MVALPICISLCLSGQRFWAESRAHPVCCCCVTWIAKGHGLVYFSVHWVALRMMKDVQSVAILWQQRWKKLIQEQTGSFTHLTDEIKSQPTHLAFRLKYWLRILWRSQMLPMNHFTPGWNILSFSFAAACCYKDSAELLEGLTGGYRGEIFTIPFSETQVCIEELSFLISWIYPRSLGLLRRERTGHKNWLLRRISPYHCNGGWVFCLFPMCFWVGCWQANSLLF